MFPRIGTAPNNASTQAASRTNANSNVGKQSYSRYAQPTRSVPSNGGGSNSDGDSFGASESDELSSDTERRSRSAPLVSGVGQARPPRGGAATPASAWTAGKGSEESLPRALSRGSQSVSPSNAYRATAPSRPPLEALATATPPGPAQRRAETSGGGRAPERMRPPPAPVVEVYDMGRLGRGPGGSRAGASAGAGGEDITDSESDGGDDGGDAAGRNFLQQRRRAAAAASAAGWVESVAAEVQRIGSSLIIKGWREGGRW